MADLQTMRAIVAKADNPDAEIQYYDAINQKWHNTGSESHKMLSQANEGQEYRIKPNTITLNGRELPKPSKPFNFSANKMHSGDFSLSFTRTYHKTESDAQAWVYALNELFGEGK